MRCAALGLLPDDLGTDALVTALGDRAHAVRVRAMAADPHLAPIE